MHQVVRLDSCDAAGRERHSSCRGSAPVLVDEIHANAATVIRDAARPPLRRREPELDGDKVDDPRRGIRAVRADEGHRRVRPVLDAERLRVVTMVDAAETRPLRPGPAVTRETAFAAPDEASVQDERPRANVLNRRSRHDPGRANGETGCARPAQSQRHPCRNAGERDGQHHDKNSPSPHPPLRLRYQQVDREGQAWST